jgi:hypothetical protein
LSAVPGTRLLARDSPDRGDPRTATGSTDRVRPGDDPDEDRPAFVRPGRRFPWIALVLAAGVLLGLAVIGAGILFILFTLETLAH